MQLASTPESAPKHLTGAPKNWASVLVPQPASVAQKDITSPKVGTSGAAGTKVQSHIAGPTPATGDVAGNKVETDIADPTPATGDAAGNKLQDTRAGSGTMPPPAAKTSGSTFRPAAPVFVPSFMRTIAPPAEAALPVRHVVMRSGGLAASRWSNGIRRQPAPAYEVQVTTTAQTLGTQIVADNNPAVSERSSSISTIGNLAKDFKTMKLSD